MLIVGVIGVLILGGLTLGTVAAMVHSRADAVSSARQGWLESGAGDERDREDNDIE